MPDKQQPRFVVHEHHARSLHWDLRLEHDGVLVSWAVPKGMPTDPKRNRLAIHVEDHPLDYIDFEGEIPKGSYGAGSVEIWDRGSYEEDKFRKDEVIVTFHGERLRGKYAIFQTNGKNWLIHRMDPPDDPPHDPPNDPLHDPPDDPPDGRRDPVPDRIVPMMATLSESLPEGEGWAYEVKWDGVRAILHVVEGSVSLTSRNLRDVTSQYPELRGLGPALGGREALLDGEIVAFDDDAKPDFGRLQHRMHIGSESAALRLASSIPVVYMAFDLLYLDGRLMLALPYRERRERLEALRLEGPHWRAPAHHVGDGAALLAASREQGLEGIVAKRLESPYTPGKRSRDWLKVKNTRRQEFVVGGWRPGKGARAESVGSLAVGYYDVAPAEAKQRGEPQRLVYAGNVGAGLKQADLRELERLLRPLERPDSSSTAASRRAAPFSCSRSSSRRSSSGTGLTTGRFGPPRSRGSETTRTRIRSCSSGRSSPRPRTTEISLSPRLSDAETTPRRRKNAQSC